MDVKNESGLLAKLCVEDKPEEVKNELDSAKDGSINPLLMPEVSDLIFIDSLYSCVTL